MAQDAFRKDNHYIPRLYLKPWEFSDGKVWTYKILVPHQNVPLWKSKTKKAVAWHSHLYTQVVTGHESDQIERWFATEYESPAEAPLRKAVTDKPLNREDWKRLIRFAALQDVRTPAWLIQQMKRLDETLPQLMKETMEASIRKIQEAKNTSEAVQFSKLPDGEREGLPLRVTVRRLPTGGGELGAEMLRGRQLWHWSIKRALTKTAKVLLQHRWTILKPSKGSVWITSDNPVIRLNYNSPSDYNFNGGWGSRNTCIVLPLGPEHLLFTQIGERPPRRGERMSQEHTGVIRKATAEHAWRMVFASDTDHQVASWRPRFVDADEVRRERDQWSNWHTQQSDAEREIAISH